MGEVQGKEACDIWCGRRRGIGVGDKGKKNFNSVTDVSLTQAQGKLYQTSAEKC